MSDTHQLIDAINREIYIATGRRYKIDWTDLDPGPLREVLRLLRDLANASQMRARRAQRTPWRLP